MQRTWHRGLQIRIVIVALVAHGWLLTATAQEPRELGNALLDFVDLQLPAGPGPHPLAILLPGCLGWHPHHDGWRRELLERGYAVLHVDSFAAHGLEGHLDLEREVCSGMQVRGDERAGDLMAVLAVLEAREDIARGHSVLFGWSHGGWAAFEFLGRLEAGLAPPNLTRVPPLTGYAFRAAFLYYPFCGPGSAQDEAYPVATRTLVFHGTRDTITNPEQCRRRVAVLAAAGAEIEFVALPNARHWFDNYAERELYDDAAATRAQTAVRGVLEELQNGAD